MERNDKLQQEIATAKQIKVRPVVNVALLKSLDIEVGQFEQTFNKLCKRWWDKSKFISDIASDTTGRRLATSTLSHINDPIVMAMIADDVELFKRYYSPKVGDVYCLEFCCLCGSEKIIRSCYLEDNNNKKCLLSSDNAIGYALSSGNIKLTYSLAKEALTLGKTDAGQVGLFSCGRFGHAVKIKAMFSARQDELKKDEDMKTDVPNPNKPVAKK